jgi:hypothetical protein
MRALMIGLLAAAGGAFTPASLFANGETGGWFSRDNFSLLFTTSAGNTNVSTIDDPIGRNERKSGTVHALQATTTKRPLLRQLPTGQYSLYHDRIDDLLTLESMTAGTYSYAAASFSDVQIGTFTLNTTGTMNLPIVDAIETIIINRALTSGEITNLTNYLLTVAPTIGATDIVRLYCSSSSVNLSLVETGGSSGATWELGDGQTASGTSCVKTISAPKSVILRATSPQRINLITFSAKSLYGQLNLKSLTALVSPRFDSNQFSGTLNLSTNTALVSPRFDSNQFSGTLDLSTNTALVSPYFSANQFSGTLDLSKNTELVSPNFSTNQFSGTLNLSTNTALVSPYFQFNKLSGTLDLSTNTALVSPRFDNNQFSGTLNLSTNTALLNPNFSVNQFSGTLNLSANTALVSPSFNNNQFSGTLDLSTNTALVSPNFSVNQFSGTLNLSANTALVSPQFYSNQFSGTLDLSTNTALVSPAFSTNQFSGTLNLSTNTALLNPNFSVNQFSGTLNLSANTALVSPSFNNNQFSGTLDLSTNTALVSPNFSSNKFTDFTGTVSNTISSFQIQNNLLPASAVNAILAAFVAAGRTGANTLSIGGTGNAAPTGQGITDKATLQSRGWTVTTN